MKWSVSYMNAEKREIVTETVEAYSFKEDQDKVTFFDGEGKAVAYFTGVNRVLKAEN